MSTAVLEGQAVNSPPNPQRSNGRAERLYTQAEFDAMDNRGWELVDGRLEKKGMGMDSSGIGVNFLVAIAGHVRTKKLGRVFGSECGFHLFSDRPRHLRKPDISFVQTAKLPGGKVPEGWGTMVPDLVVEVVSPRDLVEKLETKIGEYVQAGVRLLWVVHPKQRRVDIYRPGQPNQSITDTLSGEDVLPGFSVTLDELLAE